MHSRLVRLIGWSTVWALCACGDKPTEVELQLFPCDLSSGAPTSVELTIQARGEGGDIGEPLSKNFPIADQAVFDDGFATVGFKPPTGTLTADITVVWKSGGEAVEANYIVTVPAVGEALALGKNECDDGSGTTSTTMTTSDPTTVGTSTTEGTSETGTDSETGTTTSTTTETTNTTSTSSTSTTTETTTESTTTTTTTETTSTTDTTMGTTGDAMEGGDCFEDGALACDGGPGVLGDLLRCKMGKWVVMNELCSAGACADVGFSDPKAVGCVGTETQWSCACAETPQGECTMGMQSKCGGPAGDGVLVELCIEDGPNTYYYAAVCPDCELVDGEPLCMTE